MLETVRQYGGVCRGLQWRDVRWWLRWHHPSLWEMVSAVWEALGLTRMKAPMIESTKINTRSKLQRKTKNIKLIQFIHTSFKDVQQYI